MRLVFHSASVICQILSLAYVWAGAGHPVAAATLDFDTGLDSAWTVTGAGAVDAIPYYLSLPAISITSNSDDTGQFVSHGKLSNFKGLWYADFDFTIPANATNVSMTFSNLFADDRVVLQLNGINLGDYFLQGNFFNPPGQGEGVMDFPSLNADAPYDFTGITSGTVTKGFVTGVNDIRLVVNNTGSQGLTTPTQTFTSSTDGTEVGVLGNVSYTIVPEPTTFALSGIVVLLFLLRRRVEKADVAGERRAF